MKCDVVKDLLPLYIDGIASEASRQEVEEHLQECEECRAIYDQMKAPVGDMNITSPDKEINFLKKIKINQLKSILIIIGAMLLFFVMVTALFFVGSSVKKEDMKYSYRIEDNTLWIDFELENGKDLLMRTETSSETDENNEIDKVTQTLTPCQVFNNPFDDVGKSFDMGIDLSNYHAGKGAEHKIIVQFADEELVIDPYEAAKELEE